MTDHVSLVEVGPRDGLQNEKTPLSVETKIELINRLSACGFDHIEAGAFVSPKWVPQMASSTDVIAGIDRRPGICYSALTPNMKGYQAALDATIGTVAVFVAASEAFNKTNINATIDESFERFAPIYEAAHRDGIRVRGYVSCVLGCPYQGEVPIADVVRVSRRLFDMGAYEISLGDTIGVGTPVPTRQLLQALKGEMPVGVLAGHFHNTYGMAIANIYAALEEGVTVFDSSVAGLGGCPYAKGASGNVASEDVVYMLERSGIRTNIDLTRLIDTGEWISGHLARSSESKVAQALTRKD